MKPDYEMDLASFLEAYLEILEDEGDAAARRLLDQYRFDDYGAIFKDYSLF